ncbi:MAG: undecaprenyl-diphosphate phosphatase [Clostridia bacterium]|nr:undecaprenyl-diphosphate phosphatase [Clostridia bacterium]
MEFLEILKVILLGIVEGITEWLPISSTGHMLLLDGFWPLAVNDTFKQVFLYVIQLGAVLAVVCLFFKKIFPFALTKKEENGIKKSKIVTKKETLLLWAKILVACLPALIGLFLDMPESPLIIAIALIVYGVAFILVELLIKKKNKAFQVEDVSAITFKHAIIIGVFQVLAIIPGTSRSGITILTALLIGISRPAGAEFTFFLAIPVMLGASLLKILKTLLDGYVFTGAEIGYLLIGAAVAFVVSMLAVKLLMSFVRKHDFTPFGWYRIGLGVVVIVLIACNLLPAFV